MIVIFSFMKREHLLIFFASFIGVAVVLMWLYISPMGQVNGAFLGVPGTDAVGPLMGVLLVVWFMLVGFVVYLNRPER